MRLYKVVNYQYMDRILVNISLGRNNTSVVELPLVLARSCSTLLSNHHRCFNPNLSQREMAFEIFINLKFLVLSHPKNQQFRVKSYRFAQWDLFFLKIYTLRVLKIIPKLPRLGRKIDLAHGLFHDTYFL